MPETVIDAPIVVTPEPAGVGEPALVIDATGRAHGEGGKFVSPPTEGEEIAGAADEGAGEGAAVTSEGEASAEAATTTEPPVIPVRKITGRLNGQPYEVELPEGFEIPWKRGSEEGHASLDDYLKAPFLEKDYQHKMYRVGQERRTVEAMRAEMQARNDLLVADRKALMEAAAQGGDAFARQLRHLELLETDPEYRQRTEDAHELRVRRAVDAFHEAEAEQDADQSTAARIQAYVQQEQAKYPGVDVGRVLSRYRQGIIAGDYRHPDGTPRFHADDIDAVFAEEASALQAAAAPVQTEVAQLRAKLADLERELATVRHNTTTRKALERTGKPPVGQPVGRSGVAAGAPDKPAPFNPDVETLADAEKRWAAYLDGRGSARRTA